MAKQLLASSHIGMEFLESFVAFVAFYRSVLQVL